MKRKSPSAPVTMAKGFYLKKGIWYKRVYKPDPKSGVWKLRAESTHCKEEQRQEAIDYIARRTAELEPSKRLKKTYDPGKVTMDELFDDLLANVPHEPTRKNYAWVIESHLRPYFGHMFALEVTAQDCQAYRAHRRGRGIKDTTINRDLSKVSKAFKVALKLGKVHQMPPGGCDFHKRPETENTRRVRLPDRYYAFFRDNLHPALRCAFVVGYNIGRRLSEILLLRWDHLDFEERCIYFEATKFGAGKAPFMGEMEVYLREQKVRRDELFPESPFVFFWFDYRIDKNGERITRFEKLWDRAVTALAAKTKDERLEPIDLHFHDLRRSAHFQMRKAGIDAHTRRDIMGHESTSMDDRYTMIDDEALEQARQKMEAFQRQRGLIDDDPAIKIEVLRAEIRRLEDIATERQRTTLTP